MQAEAAGLCSCLLSPLHLHLKGHLCFFGLGSRVSQSFKGLHYHKVLKATDQAQTPCVTDGDSGPGTDHTAKVQTGVQRPIGEALKRPAGPCSKKVALLGCPLV